MADDFYNLSEWQRETNTPKYSMLKSMIINKIKAGELAEEQRLPNELEFCDMLGISRTTARKAMDELVQEGYIYRIRGKGTYVNSKRKIGDLKKLGIKGCNELIRAQNMESGKIMLSVERISCDEPLAELMNIEVGAPFLKYERVYTANSTPAIYAKSFLNLSALRDLNESELDTDSLMELLYAKYGSVFTRERRTLRAARATAEIAACLKTEEGFPLLFQSAILRCTIDSITTASEYSCLYYHTDRIRFTPEARE